MVQVTQVPFGTNDTGDHAHLAHRADFSGRERDRFFVSLDRAGRFEDLSYFSGADAIEDGRAFARADLDRDGYEDLVLMNRNAPLLRVFLNQLGPRSGNDFVGLELEGREGQRDAAGARATARCGDRRVTRHVLLGAGMGTVNARTLTFGLGKCSVIDELSVKFPSGSRQSFRGVAARKLYHLREGGELIEVPGIYATQREPGAEPADAGALLDRLEALAPLKHDVVYVTWWASWCESCKRHQPRIDAYARWLGAGADFVGPSAEPKDDAAAVAAYASERAPVSKLLAYDATLAEAAAAAGADLHVLPVTLVLDRRSRRVLHVGAGVPDLSTVRRVTGGSTK